MRQLRFVAIAALSAVSTNAFALGGWTYSRNPLTPGLSGDIYLKIIEGDSCNVVGKKYRMVNLVAIPLLGGAFEFDPCANSYVDTGLATSHDPFLVHVPSGPAPKMGLGLGEREKFQLFSPDTYAVTKTFDTEFAGHHEGDGLFKSESNGRIAFSVDDGTSMVGAYLYRADGSTSMEEKHLEQCALPQLGVDSAGRYAFTCYSTANAASGPGLRFYKESNPEHPWTLSDPILISGTQPVGVHGASAEVRFLDADGSGTPFDPDGLQINTLVPTWPRPGLVTQPSGRHVALFRTHHGSASSGWWYQLGITYSTDDGTTWSASSLAGAEGRDILGSAIVRDSSSGKIVVAWAERQANWAKAHDVYVSYFTSADFGPNLASLIAGRKSKVQSDIDWRKCSGPSLQYWLGLTAFDNFVAVNYLNDTVTGCDQEIAHKRL